MVRFTVVFLNQTESKLFHCIVELDKQTYYGRDGSTTS